VTLNAVTGPRPGFFDRARFRVDRKPQVRPARDRSRRRGHGESARLEATRGVSPFGSPETANRRGGARGEKQRLYRRSVERESRRKGRDGRRRETAVGQSSSREARRGLCLQTTARFSRRLTPYIRPPLISLLPPSDSSPRRRSDYGVDALRPITAEAFGGSNSRRRSFDHDPEERPGSIRARSSRPAHPRSRPRKFIFAVRSHSSSLAREDPLSILLSSFILLIGLAGP